MEGLDLLRGGRYALKIPEDMPRVRVARRGGGWLRERSM